jgi:small subunit ribosomal protein S8
MYVNDPIGDLLTRIRNAHMAKHSSLSVSASKMKERVLSVLLDEGFIASYEIDKSNKFDEIKIELKYNSKTGDPVISEIKRISKPGRKMYVGASELQPFKNGYGVYVLTTSKGVITDRKAKELNVGGELICSVW